MSRRTRIPKFGSWDSSEGNNTPFTEVFEDARAAKAGRVLNPNDPVDNPEAFTGRGSRSHLPKAANTTDSEGRKPISHARRLSKEDAEDAPARRQIDPPTHRVQVDDSRYVPQAGATARSSVDNAPRRVGHSNSANETGSVGTLSEREQLDHGHASHRSPMHHQQAYATRHTNRMGAGSPARERRTSTDGSTTPGRSRLRTSTNNTDPSEKGAQLPKFGAWDANDPASGDGFTMIFNNARNEKKAGGSVHVPPLGFDGRNDKDLYPGKTAATQSKASSKKLFCCFQPTAVEA